MKVLLLDDKQDRIQDIEEIIHDFNLELTTSHSLEDAKFKLKSQKYDIVIIDLFVPENYHLRALSKFGGYELVRYIFNELEEFNFISGVVIVSDNLNDIDYFDDLMSYPISIVATNNDDWNKRLSNAISYFCLKINPIDIAIITALEVEFQAIYDDSWERVVDSGGITFYRKTYRTKSNNYISAILFRSDDKGMVSTCIAMSHLFKHFKPKRVFMIGVSAGNPSKTNFGDIIVAKNTCDYSCGSVVDNENELEFFSEPRVLSISDTMSATFSDYSINNDLTYAIRKKTGMMDIYTNDIRIKIGLMACGSLVVKSSRFTEKFILPHNKNFMGIDMETYAVYYSCKKNGCNEYVSIKSVSDYGDKDKTHEYQKYCSKLSAELLKYYIDNEL